MWRFVASAVGAAALAVGSFFGAVGLMTGASPGAFSVSFGNGDTIPFSVATSAKQQPPSNRLSAHTVTFGQGRSTQFTVTLTPGGIVKPAPPPVTTTSTSTTTPTSSSTSTSTSTSSTTTTTSTSSTHSAGSACLVIPSPLPKDAGFDNPLPANQYPSFAALDACGFPSPDTAGVPAGMALTPVGQAKLPANVQWIASSGELAVTGPATITSISIPDGFVAIQTDGPVTFDDDLIRNSGGQSGNGIINTEGHSGVTVENSTVGGTGGGSNCQVPVSQDIGPTDGGAVLSRDVFDCAVEPVNGSGYTLTGSYVIVDGYSASSHNEALYQPGGGSNVITGNTLLDPLSASAVLFLDSKLGTEGKTTISGNLIAGAGYGDGAVVEGGGNVSVTGNVFSGAYGESDQGADCSNTVWSGNTVDGSGAVVGLNSSGKSC